VVEETKRTGTPRTCGCSRVKANAGLRVLGSFVSRDAARRVRRLGEHPLMLRELIGGFGSAPKPLGTTC
jgi:hypothetical protein